MNSRMLRALALGALLLPTASATAGALDLFLVTRGTQHVAASFWGDQAACDAIAASSAALTCQGKVNVPPAVHAGAYRYDGTQFVRIVNLTAELRAAALDMDRRLTAIQAGFHLLTGSGEATAAELRIAREFIYWARRGAAIVLLRSGFAAARKLEFARAMARGPGGGGIIDQIRQHSLSAPTSPIVWANPNVRGAPPVLMTAIATLSGHEEGNPNSLNLQNSELTGIDVRRDASWVGRLTAF